ncbi:hypothetical protein HY407_01285 [Candidatus Gottesmanbacteria bacterium]|nr:hypothetical protein [Candidatus Gottesmanbacteria bacterium]
MSAVSWENLPEFDNHRMVSFVADSSCGLKAYIALHRGNTKHPAFGATRLWSYKTEEEALKDVLDLSKLMSYKAALAQLPYGGGKGVILSTPKTAKSKKLHSPPDTISDREAEKNFTRPQQIVRDT